MRSRGRGRRCRGRSGVNERSLPVAHAPKPLAVVHLAANLQKKAAATVPDGVPHLPFVTVTVRPRVPPAPADDAVGKGTLEQRAVGPHDAALAVHEALIK